MSPPEAAENDRLERFKAEAAEAAVALVESGMTLGLGSGSTARYATLAIGRRLAAGELERLRGVPTSEATAELAREAGIPLVELPAGGVDLTIDGMDEVDGALDAIKGLGGALFREKIVASSARRFVLIGDATKRVEALGSQAPLPVEVGRFGWRRTATRLAELGLEPVRRERGGDPVETDNGNLIFDCRLEPPVDARALGERVRGIPGVIEHGFFLGLAERAIIATPEGVLELIRDASAGGPDGSGP